ncbi:uncharacterized protein METZ01_LOCUS153595 [marine metagenome]|uniref:Uncharacterized protein n=1 Tax=marine metagenome TaxID=408172 RepID=A0A382AHI5_9ZZZZ
MAKKREKPEEPAEITLSIRLTKEQREHVADAAKELGCSTTRLIKTAALERAVHVLNVRRATSFDFRETARWVAGLLFREPTFGLGDSEIENDERGEQGRSWRIASDSPELNLGQILEMAKRTAERDVAEDGQGGLEVAILPQRGTCCADLSGYRELLRVTRLGGVEFWRLVLDVGEVTFARELGTEAPEPIDPEAV